MSRSGAVGLLWLSLATAAAGGPADGPQITHIGIASPSELPVAPEPVEENGRQVFPWPQGHSFFLVIEAQPGPDLRPVGISTLAYDPEDASVLPDLQILLSNDLGNGNPVVCESGDVDVGIPAIPSLVFAETPAVAAAINDLGCRFNDGEGRPAGRERPDDACTRSPITLDPQFVAPGTTVQFCAFIARPFELPSGDTNLAVRVRDTSGRLSPQREAVIRVTGFNPTPTDTRPTATRTPSPSPTRTRTPTPLPPCPGDCNGDGELIVSELLTAVNVALDRVPLTECRNADHNGDQVAGVDDLTAAVTALLHGC